MARVLFEYPGIGTKVMKVLFDDGAEVVEITKYLISTTEKTVVTKSSDGKVVTVTCDEERNDGRDPKVR